MASGSDAENFREAIIGASLELGQAYGEDGVTMRAIATKLGTSATTLYTCFDSKASIMRELRLRGLMLLGGSVVEALETVDEREAMVLASRRYIAFARENPWLYTLLFVGDTPTAEVLNGEQGEVVAAIERRVRQRFAEIHKAVAGQAGANARRMLGRWWAGVHGLASLLITRRVKEDHLFLPLGDMDTFIDEYARAVVDGLVLGCVAKR